MPPSDSSANGDDRDVLTSLPRTRPARRSAKRDGAARTSAASVAATKPQTATRSPRATAKPKPAAKPRAAAKPKAAAAKPRAAARPRAATASPRPAEPPVPPAGYATAAPEHRHVPDPFAVMGTAVQAAGELAQIGATLWTQAVRSAVSRLPKP